MSQRIKSVRQRSFYHQIKKGRETEKRKKKKRNKMRANTGITFNNFNLLNNANDNA